MNSVDVIDFYRAVTQLGTAVWIDGGWGVDALLGHQTRPHKDLDIAIEQTSVEALRQLLHKRGYRDVKLEDARPWNFVLGDESGREIDVHVIVLDDRGNGIYGPPEKGEMYPAASLTGAGTMRARPFGASPQSGWSSFTLATNSKIRIFEMCLLCAGNSGLSYLQNTDDSRKVFQSHSEV